MLGTVMGVPGRSPCMEDWDTERGDKVVRWCWAVYAWVGGRVVPCVVLLCAIPVTSIGNASVCVLKSITVYYYLMGACIGCVLE